MILKQGVGVFWWW